MNRQQVFATKLYGFDKKAVLDYIYEQDMQFKKKETEYEQQIAELTERLGSYESTAPAAEQFQEQLEALTISYNDEKETVQSLQSRYDKLSAEIDQLLKVAGNKERELQLQLEINSQLKCKCEMLESKLKVLADHLIAERELLSSLPDPSIIPHVKPADEQLVVAELLPEEICVAQADDLELQPEAEVCHEVVDLKVELDEFRQSVSRTLLNFEAALARLQTSKTEDAGDNTAFFQ